MYCMVRVYLLKIVCVLLSIVVNSPSRYRRLSLYQSLCVWSPSNPTRAHLRDPQPDMLFPLFPVNSQANVTTLVPVLLEYRGNSSHRIT